MFKSIKVEIGSLGESKDNNGDCGVVASFRQASLAESAQGGDVCEVKTSLSFGQRGIWVRERSIWCFVPRKDEF